MFRITHLTIVNLINFSLILFIYRYPLHFPKKDTFTSSLKFEGS